MKETTIIQMELNDLKQILKQAQIEALQETQGHMYDKFSHVTLSVSEICRLHGTSHRTINDMVAAKMIFPDENGKFLASEVLKWDFNELRKKLRYVYKVA